MLKVWDFGREISKERDACAEIGLTQSMQERFYISSWWKTYRRPIQYDKNFTQLLEGDITWYLAWGVSLLLDEKMRTSRRSGA